MNEIYPWLMPQWEHLQHTRREGRLPHGLLLSGPAGVGKRSFAAALAGGLLCRQPGDQGLACGLCESCRLLQAGTHPDDMLLQPAEGKTQILIDQVRELCTDLALKSHAGGYKIARLIPAEALNNAAANSLLKTLEEPSDNTLLILVSEQPARLAATLRSRCQQLRFTLPATDVAQAWLSSQGVEDAALNLCLSAGAPLRAITLTQADHTARHRWVNQLIEIHKGVADPLLVAAEWTRDADASVLEVLSHVVSDMLHMRNGSSNSIKNIDLLENLEKFSTLISDQELHRRLERIWHTQILAGTAGINRQLLIEALLMEWIPAGQPRRRA